MRTNIGYHVGIGLLAATLAPSIAFAQQQAPPAPAVMMPGPTVFVLDSNSKEIKGRLLRLDTSEVAILVDGNERRFDLSQVRRVQKRGDSLKNGAIAGAIVGFLAGIGAAQVTSSDGEAVVGVLVGTAIYAAIGTGIDAMIQGRSTLYQAPTVTARASRTGARPAASTLRLIRLTW
jgi:hypothetical protein